MKVKYWGWSSARLWLRKFGAGSDHSAYWSILVGPVEVILPCHG